MSELGRVEKHYTPAEVSELTGISVATLRNWRFLGEGPCFVKIGGSKRGRVRYPASAVNEYMAGKRRTLGVEASNQAWLLNKIADVIQARDATALYFEMQRLRDCLIARGIECEKPHRFLDGPDSNT